MEPLDSFEKFVMLIMAGAFALAVIIGFLVFMVV